MTHNAWPSIDISVELSPPLPQAGLEAIQQIFSNLSQFLSCPSCFNTRPYPNAPGFNPFPA